MLETAAKPGVLVYGPVDSTGASHRQLEAAGCDVIVADPAEPLSVRLDVGRPVQALLGATLRPERLEAKYFDRLPELRIVSRYTIGVDDVDVEAATRLGILITHCPTEANWGGVAEGTIALMLAMLKRVVERNAWVKAGRWRSDALRGTYLGSREDGYPGITLGILGFGRIGRRVAGLMSPWKLRMIASDPYVDSSVFAEYGVEAVELDTLLRQSDVLSVHCSLSEETSGLIDRQALSKMRRHAILLNTARGQIVDVEAVCDALDAGLLGGAAFDVLPEEPPPERARIRSMDQRVVLSPHMVAANQGGTLEAAIPWATDAVLMALKGEVPPHVYNERAIDAWCARFSDKSLLPDPA